MENLEAESIDMKEECVLLLPYTRTKKDIFIHSNKERYLPE
ncbi:MAG: hypothetical protein ACTSQ9_05230 [Candidatus Hodarchaeales archaeon]